MNQMYSITEWLGLLLLALLIHCVPSNCSFKTSFHGETCSKLSKGCSVSSQPIYIKTNEPFECSVYYQEGCSRQWILERDGYNLSKSYAVERGSVLNITYLDLDFSAKDYLLVGFGYPGQFSSQALVFQTNIFNETKSIYIQSGVTWMGLVNGVGNGQNYRTGSSLVFSWTPPVLTEVDEDDSVELRASSVDICFDKIDCVVIHEDRKALRASITEKINSYFQDGDGMMLTEPIEVGQVKILRNESRIKDEKTMGDNYCRVQLAVTSESDVNWPHQQLKKDILHEILFANRSLQIIPMGSGGLIYEECEDNSFDSWMSLQSAAIFVAGLAVAIGLWRWQNSNSLSVQKRNNAPEVPSETVVNKNPIYESDGEDDGPHHSAVNITNR